MMDAEKALAAEMKYRHEGRKDVAQDGHTFNFHFAHQAEAEDGNEKHDTSTGQFASGGGGGSGGESKNDIHGGGYPPKKKPGMKPAAAVRSPLQQRGYTLPGGGAPEKAGYSVPKQAPARPKIRGNPNDPQVRAKAAASVAAANAAYEKEKQAKAAQAESRKPLFTHGFARGAEFKKPPGYR